MEKPAGALFRAVLLLAGLNAALTQEETINLAVGATLELRPPVSGTITSLLWKHEGNMVVEWLKDKLDKTYGNFLNRTSLNKVTGVLEITDMTAADAGKYTVEINKKVEGRVYRVEVMKKVPKPSVEFKPLACSSSDSCGLSCEGDTEGAEPVEYSWKIGEGPWEKRETVSVTRADNPHDKRFICRMKNPVSEEESEPKDNPFYVEEVQITMVPAIVVGVIVSIIIIVLAGLGFWKKNEIKKLIGGNGANNGVADVEGGGPPAVKLTNTVPTTNEGSAPAAGDVEGNPQGVTPSPAGANTNEGSAPAAENGVRSPSENADDPDESTNLVAKADP